MRADVSVNEQCIKPSDWQRVMNYLLVELEHPAVKINVLHKHPWGNMTVKSRAGNIWKS